MTMYTQDPYHNQVSAGLSHLPPPGLPASTTCVPRPYLDHLPMPNLLSTALQISPWCEVDMFIPVGPVCHDNTVFPSLPQYQSVRVAKTLPSATWVGEGALCFLYANHMEILSHQELKKNNKR